MRNEHIKDSFEQLNSMLVKSKEMIEQTEKNINNSIDLLMTQCNPEDINTVQNHIKKIKTLLNRAKKGENIDSEINNFKNTFKNGRNR
jgi:ATP-dependent Zn protease